jgi:hypothetical protein
MPLTMHDVCGAAAAVPAAMSGEANESTLSEFEVWTQPHFLSPVLGLVDCLNETCVWDSQPVYYRSTIKFSSSCHLSQVHRPLLRL